MIDRDASDRITGKYRLTRGQRLRELQTDLRKWMDNGRNLAARLDALIQECAPEDTTVIKLPTLPPKTDKPQGKTVLP